MEINDFPESIAFLHKFLENLINKADNQAIMRMFLTILESKQLTLASNEQFKSL
jgi:hypothetical protein